MILQNRSDGV